MLKDNISHYSQTDIYFLLPVSKLSDKDSSENMNQLSSKQVSAPSEVVARTQQEFEFSNDEAELQNDHEKCVPPKKITAKTLPSQKLVGLKIYLHNSFKVFQIVSKYMFPQ